MRNKRVLILSSQSGEWVGIYIDQVLVQEGHRLPDALEFLKLAESFEFTSKDVYEEELNEEDEIDTEKKGSFYNYLPEFKGYTQYR